MTESCPHAERACSTPCRLHTAACSTPPSGAVVGSLLAKSRSKLDRKPPNDDRGLPCTHSPSKAVIFSSARPDSPSRDSKQLRRDLEDARLDAHGPRPAIINGFDLSLVEADRGGPVDPLRATPVSALPIFCCCIIGACLHRHPSNIQLAARHRSDRLSVLQDSAALHSWI
jgi:hypothetical protein